MIRTSSAQNLYIGIERLTESELEGIRKRCEERAKDFVAAKAEQSRPGSRPQDEKAPESAAG